MPRKAGVVVAIVVALLYKPLEPTCAQAVTDSFNAVLQQRNLSKEDRVTTMALLSRSMIFTNTRAAMNNARQALELASQVPDKSYTALVYATLAQLYHQDGGDMLNAGIAIDSAL